MKKLFVPDSLKIVESLSFTRTVYAFDFDGTLSKIVRDPESASIALSTERLLQELARHAPVAIISGRSIADLRTKFRSPPDTLIGNHGLEGLGTRPDALDIARKICAGWRSDLASQLSDGDSHEGLEIEDKSFSIALHYRKSPAKKKTRTAILKAAANLDPAPRLILGKCVVNLLPPGAPHKGVALVELMLQRGLKSAFYIGDDDTDEDVFSLPNARILTVRVGRKASSQAQYFIDTQSDIDRVLKTILGFYRTTHADPKSANGKKGVTHDRV